MLLIRVGWIIFRLQDLPGSAEGPTPRHATPRHYLAVSVAKWEVIMFYLEGTKLLLTVAMLDGSEICAKKCDCVEQSI